MSKLKITLSTFMFTIVVCFVTVTFVRLEN